MKMNCDLCDKELSGWSIMHGANNTKFCSQCFGTEEADALAEAGAQIVSIGDEGELLDTHDSSEAELNNDARHGKGATLGDRYKVAYIHASAVVGFGDTLKVIGFVLGGVAFLFALLTGNRVLVFGGLVSSAIIVAAFYLFGVIVMVQGQILQATLDSAVNSSPLITNEQKARMMSLDWSQISSSITGKQADAGSAENSATD